MVDSKAEISGNRFHVLQRLENKRINFEVESKWPKYPLLRKLGVGDRNNLKSRQLIRRWYSRFRTRAMEMRTPKMFPGGYSSIQ